MSTDDNTKPAAIVAPARPENKPVATSIASAEGSEVSASGTGEGPDGTTKSKTKGEEKKTDQEEHPLGRSKKWKDKDDQLQSVPFVVIQGGTLLNCVLILARE